MNKNHVLKNMRQSIVTTLVLMIICGLIFPVALSGLGSLLFPHQAGGSLIKVDGKVVGAEHIGQQFTESYFMKGRPSAVGYNTYNSKAEAEAAGPASGSQNLAPTNPELAERVEKDIAAFLAANPDVSKEDIPTDLLTASGSGLDPEISPASAKVQIPAIAKAAGLSEDQISAFVKDNTKGKLLGIFGEETVNVLGVNLDIAEAMGLIGSSEK